MSRPLRAVKPTKAEIKILREAGDVAFRVMTHKGRKVLYIWQAFAFVRLTESQMKQVVKECKATLRDAE